MSDFSVLKYYYLNINYSVNTLSECLHILIDCSQLSKTCIIITRCSVVLHEKFTRKASDAATCSVLPLEIVMHDAYVGERSENNILNPSCVTISGERTEQLVIIASFLPRHWLYE